MRMKRISGIFCIFLLTGLSLVGLDGLLTSLTESNPIAVTLTLISVMLIAVITTTFFVCFSEDNRKEKEKEKEKKEDEEEVDDKEEDDDE